ncbi:MAG: proline--tRNA ligase [Verrucomicrobia bacterium]|nr:proline--tRNA ligase [Kiritimatiellia bacterium]MCO6400275.1 proline--tRNA ligase [Verrucomicrobiota bacterium]
MIFRWTQQLIPTLREVPGEAEIPSHQWMLRAGLIRKLGAGLYTFLPLGLRSLRKVERIVREEMDRAGALEVLMPALQPPEIWQQSGRYKAAAEVLFKVEDRAGREWLLGPTHEEVITTLVANEINSYRQLPRNFYQIQVKFRDEIRPRFGLMRAKEFIMKDAYSFDATDEGATISYQKMYEAYTRIFQRCGLKTIVVEADTGVMGGKFSHEFVVPADTGEDEVAYTDSGRYAANLEKATSRGPVEPTPSVTTGPAPEKFATPGVTTIEDLAAEPHRVPAHQQIKTLVYIADGKTILALLRGDDQLNEAKFAAAAGTTLFRPATAEECHAALGAHPGSLGAVGVKNVTVLADTLLREARGMVTGANEDGYHLRHVDAARDLAITGWHDLRTVRADESSVETGEPLRIRRAIEVGHVFKLGTKYSEAMNARFLDTDGQQKPCIMGCYGIGVTRTLQAVIEQNWDANGILWPIAVAPVEVEALAINAQHAPSVEAVERVAAELSAAGIDVLLDDRDERAGVKFKDADFVGAPIRLSVGERSLAKGEVEIKLRRTGAVEFVPVADAVNRIRALVAEQWASLKEVGAVREQ